MPRYEYNLNDTLNGKHKEYFQSLPEDDHRKIVGKLREKPQQVSDDPRFSLPLAEQYTKKF